MKYGFFWLRYPVKHCKPCWVFRRILVKKNLVLLLPPPSPLFCTDSKCNRPIDFAAHLRRHYALQQSLFASKWKNKISRFCPRHCLKLRWNILPVNWPILICISHGERNVTIWIQTTIQALRNPTFNKPLNSRSRYFLLVVSFAKDGWLTGCFCAFNMKVCLMWFNCTLSRWFKCSLLRLLLLQLILKPWKLRVIIIFKATCLFHFVMWTTGRSCRVNPVI